MRQPPWRAVIFDMDDTLYPERDYVLSGFRAVAHWADEHFGVAYEAGYGQLASFFEVGIRGDTFNRWLAVFGLSETLIPDLVGVYRQHQPALTPFSGMEALLSQLKGRCQIGLISDGYLHVQQRKWAALNLAHYFDAVVFSDFLGREYWKPSTRPYTTALELLNIPASDSVYIGDNPIKDFQGARSLGISTIWARYGGGDYLRSEFTEAENVADYQVDSIAALKDMLH